MKSKIFEKLVTLSKFIESSLNFNFKKEIPMNVESKKNKRIYNTYINVRVSDEENKVLNKLLKIFKTCNKSKVIRHLINNNNIVKGNEKFT
ncbi:MAG: hypothetical protein FWH29_06905 [Methanobrevibacter sp.]|nr:hypothetical protein [Methanobrevibacter sp.]